MKRTTPNGNETLHVHAQKLQKERVERKTSIFFGPNGTFARQCACLSRLLRFRFLCKIHLGPENFFAKCGHALDTLFGWLGDTIFLVDSRRIHTHSRDGVQSRVDTSPHVQWTRLVDTPGGHTWWTHSDGDNEHEAQNSHVRGVVSDLAQKYVIVFVNAFVRRHSHLQIPNVQVCGVCPTPRTNQIVMYDE